MPRFVSDNQAVMPVYILEGRGTFDSDAHTPHLPLLAYPFLRHHSAFANVRPRETGHIILSFFSNRSPPQVLGQIRFSPSLCDPSAHDETEG